MTLLNEAVKEKKLDIRMIERNLSQGVVSKNELEQAALELADDAANADWISLDALRKRLERNP